jgi:Na+-translocating ferredoxin:NAD+ oxidoreductase subunit D
MLPGNAVRPADELPIAPGPHLWRGLSTNKIMYWVLGALIPPMAASIVFFGLRAFLIILTAVVFSVGTEWVAKKMRGRPFIMDGSAIVTGLLLALTLPPTIALWMVAVGAIFAIGIVKEAFGGLGHNIFNPALGARIFMSASFGVEMTTWILPFGADAVTTATPLNNAFNWSSRLASRLILYQDLFLGNRGGSLGETSVIAILIGAIILIAVKIIDWRIPVFYVLTAVLLTSVFSGFAEDPLIQIMTGGLLLGAVYMATDYVTSPVTHNGRIIFAVGCGLITAVIRLFGGLPEGVAYSIILMNAITPLIDRLVKPRPYGFRKPAKIAA